MRRVPFALALALFALALPAAAQTEFPNRAVTMTVGFSPGGGADIAARIVAKKLAANIGQPVLVENRPGASGSIAARHIAAAVPNGYTISLATVGALVVSPMFSRDAHFDGRRDVAPITMAMSLPGLLVVNADMPVKTLGDFVALAKSKPGELSYSTTGIGGLGHLRFETLQKAAGIQLVQVPYKGGGPEMTDLLGGRISLSSLTAASVLPHIESGKLRALAVTGTSSRLPRLPEVPTVAEAGYSDPAFEASNWFAFVAPPGTPGEILDFWNRELTKVLNDPAVKADLAKHDLFAQPGTRAELARAIATDADLWAKVAHEAHLTPN